MIFARAIISDWADLARVTRILFLMALVIAAFLIFAQPIAFAETTTTTTTRTTTTSSAPPKKTTVNFEDQLIEGQTQKPELFYLLQQRSNNFKRLIKLRENFLPEMRDTAEDFTSGSARHGSGH